MDQKDKILDVKKDGNYSYSIWLEPDFQKLPEALKQLHVSGRKLCIVSDSNVDYTIWNTAEGCSVRHLWEGDFLCISGRGRA